MIPSIVSLRWREAHAVPTIGRWRSLAQMIGSMVVNASVYTPGSQVVDDLRTLADLAYQHMRDLQPVREEETC